MTNLPLLQHWINGAPASGESTRTAPVFDPAIGSPSKNVVLASTADVDTAVAAANAAFPAWRDMSIAKRQNIMFNFRELLHKRSGELAEKKVRFLDAGTSGGIWGLEVGYCLMVGGDKSAYETILPALTTLAPKDGLGYFGKAGAGHFCKMVHNGIEYAMMQSYAEGFELLKATDFGYDLKQVTGVWNHGSVVRSWLLELAERAFTKDPELKDLKAYVDDSGEGRWTVNEAIAHAVPVPTIAASLFARFSSRQDNSFAMRVLSALRNEFGGHAVKKA